MLILTSTPRLSLCTSPYTVIWDIQTGMAIKEIATWDLGEVVFSGGQSTIALVTRPDFHLYGLSGEQICEGELLPSPDHQLGAYWVDKDSLLFAVSSQVDGELMVEIQRLQPTSHPPVLVVESFSVPPQDGEFHFSPISFHASFVSWGEVIILNVRDSKVLLQAEAIQVAYTEPGHFSPDGCFFACQTSRGDIRIWENTSTGYVAQSSLRPRLSCDGFSWSPTSPSILCWGENGVQLLHTNNHLSLTSPKCPSNPHLVAYTADQTHIATARQWGKVVAILNLSDITQQTVTINMPIQDLKIVDNTIFVTDGNRLISWHLTTGGQVGSGCNTKRENKILGIRIPGDLALSDDCSLIAFVVKQTLFLYDIKAQKVLDNLVADGHIFHLQFSPNGSHLWLITGNTTDETFKSYCVEFKRERTPCFTNVTIEVLADEWSLDTLFRSPHEYCITGTGSKWVSDSRGNILWLPPSWRSKYGLWARWNSSFLTLVDHHHPEPIIIKFQA